MKFNQKKGKKKNEEEKEKEELQGPHPWLSN